MTKTKPTTALLVLLAAGACDAKRDDSPSYNPNVELLCRRSFVRECAIHRPLTDCMADEERFVVRFCR